MCTGSIGETTKLNVLSVASASSASRTVARVLRPLTVNASNATDALLPGSTATGFVAMVSPATSSLMELPLTACSVRLVTPAVTTMRC